MKVRVEGPSSKLSIQDVGADHNHLICSTQCWICLKCALWPSSHPQNRMAVSLALGPVGPCWRLGLSFYPTLNNNLHVPVAPISSLSVGTERTVSAHSDIPPTSGLK
jgi:hypothetical protein